jgi:hypothetical protein
MMYSNPNFLRPTSSLPLPVGVVTDNIAHFRTTYAENINAGLTILRMLLLAETGNHQTPGFGIEPC